MKPLPNPLSKLLTSYGALVASTLVHGLGIAVALVSLPALALVRWHGAQRAPTVSSIMAPAAEPTLALSLPALAVVVEASSPTPLGSELPSITEQLPPPAAAPFDPAPRRAVCSDAVDWRARLRPPTAVATHPPQAPPEPPDERQRDPRPPQDGGNVAPLPIPGHNPPPRYPFVAWRHGIEGTVVVELDIDLVGAVTTAHLAQSSGSEALDDAAMQQLKTWRFSPAHGAAGPVRSTYRQEVVFRIRG